jgi:hypothetical protein
MFILVAGGFDPQDAQADEIRMLCRALGRAIAVHGHTLLNGARSELDALVAEAANEALGSSTKEDREQRILSYYLAGEEPIHNYGSRFRSQLKNWKLTSVSLIPPEPVDAADVVVLIAGSEGTIRTANWARIWRKPLLPFAYFGGAAAEIYAKELNTFEQRYSSRLNRFDFEQLNSKREPADHATRIVALAEKIAGSRSVLAVMSYDDRPELEDVYDTFERGCEKLEYVCERVTEKNADTRILPEILERIRRAAFIIVDLTDLKPNVLYELGYAHGAGQQVIVTAKKGTPLPFDLNDVPTIFWESQKRLEKDLMDRIQSVVKSAVSHATPTMDPS